jgi:putative transcriptional regulator
MNTVNLAHHFLIAMPAMADPSFSNTLAYICEHNAAGALGIIINRPMEMSLAALFNRVNMPLASGQTTMQFNKMPVYYGGPVQTDRGFVLHRPTGEWQSSLRITRDISLTSSRDILQAMGKTGQPHDALVTLGYSGWSAGQLESELAQNAWLTVAAEPQVIFAMSPEQRLVGAMKLLGIDPLNLSTVAGHA